MTPEDIKQQKLIATQVMLAYCNRQMASLMISGAMHWDLHRRIDEDEKAYRDRSGQRAEMLNSDADNFVQRCGWMLR